MKFELSPTTPPPPSGVVIMKWTAVRVARPGWFSAVFVEFECVRPLFCESCATPMRAGGRLCVGCLGALSGGQNMSEFGHLLGVAVA